MLNVSRRDSLSCRYNLDLKLQICRIKSLQDNKLKETQRDVDISIGIYAPDRHEIAEHRGYNISILRDNYRSAKILKDRDGSSNILIPLWFSGATGEFAELPRINDPELIKIYNSIKNAA